MSPVHTITSIVENWYNVPIVECKVCFAPDITNPCNKTQFSLPEVWSFNHFTLPLFTISLPSILFYIGRLYLPYFDLYTVSPQFTTICFNHDSKLWQLGKSDLQLIFAFTTVAWCDCTLSAWQLAYIMNSREYPMVTWSLQYFLLISDKIRPLGNFQDLLVVSGDMLNIHCKNFSKISPTHGLHALYFVP